MTYNILSLWMTKLRCYRPGLLPCANLARDESMTLSWLGNDREAKMRHITLIDQNGIIISENSSHLAVMIKDGLCIPEGRVALL